MAEEEVGGGRGRFCFEWRDAVDLVGVMPGMKRSIDE